MPTLSDTLPHATMLRLALRIHTPSRLAQTFATFVGQFYDRGEFDTLARQVSDLYDLERAGCGHIFRAQLDRRLCDRYHAPVAWDSVPAKTDRVA